MENPKQGNLIKRKCKHGSDKNSEAPDGGWAWFVCIAAGISNLCIYPCLQQFGLIFRDRLRLLGFSSSEITTIINTNPAISACSGLLNGPMFRYLSFRQAAIAGSILVCVGLFATSFCETFGGYMFNYACLFGFGMGISVSASSLAINTYFKEKRRRAAGFSWTITGLGPIFLPYIVTWLLSIYGIQGTVMIFASLSLHSLISALIYQPVNRHIQSKSDYTFRECTDLSDHRDSYRYTDNENTTNDYKITECTASMLCLANEGWVSSKVSIEHIEFPHLQGRHTDNNITPPQLDDLFLPTEYRSNNEKSAICISNRNSSRQKNQYAMSVNKNVLSEETTKQSDFLEHKVKTIEMMHEIPELEVKGMLKKCIHFFDLDLLRDFGFVNLVIGLTIINFGELNFATLTPFILNDFGLNETQITSAMSALAVMDIIVRFFVPFITEKILWDNRVFFLIGVMGIAVGRTVVACTRSYPIILGSFVWIGMCKGVRTIFWPLIIPGYVPLHRLPAASGLQLLITGLFTLAGGPLVGLLHERYDYSITLHFMNCLALFATISWLAEAIIARTLKNQYQFGSNETINK